jgi:hypothetical protein
MQDEIKTQPSVQASKAFFSEEKKQKTFIPALVPPSWPWPESKSSPELGSSRNTG